MMAGRDASQARRFPNWPHRYRLSIHLAGRSLAPAVRYTVLSALATLIVSAAQAQEVELARLWSLWEVRRSEIVTADVRYRQCIAFVNGSEWTPQAVAELLSRWPAEQGAEGLDEIVYKLLGRTPGTDPLWSRSRLVIQGRQARYEQGPFEQISDDQLELIQDHDNHQIGVYPRGRSRRMFAQLADLRWIPPATVDRRVLRATYEDGPAIEVTTTSGDSRSWVDAETGVVLRSQQIDPQTGELIQESWERELVDYPQGIPFPTVRIELTYKQGRLSHCWFRCVDAAEFNVEIPDAVFRLAAPSGAKVIDYRGDDSRGFTLEGGSADVRTDLPPVYFRGPARNMAAGTSGGPALRWLLLLNSALLLSGGVYLWRRESRGTARRADSRAEPRPVSRP